MLFFGKKICEEQKRLTHGKNSAVMNLFSLENVDQFPELIVSVGK